MDNTNNHSKTWSDVDIRMYLNGELSPREMHELERAALDDPFLADALEGYLAVPTRETDMGHLRSRLADRVDEKEQRRVIPWFRRPVFRVAAVVIALAGIGITAWLTLIDHRSPENTVVKNTPSIAPAAPVQAPVDTDTTRLKTDADVAVASGVASKADREVVMNKRSVKKRAASAEKPLPAEDLAAKDRVADDKLVTDSSLAFRDIATGIPSPKAAPPASFQANRLMRAQPDSLRFQDMDAGYLTKSYKAAQPLLLSGKVVDINNRPLPGASVFLNNAPKTVTTTDAFGNFNFRIRPRDTAQQMTVALVGYKQTLVPLNSNALTNNIIQLEEAKARLNEVVVTGYGTKRKEVYAAAPSEAGDERLDSSWQKVFPVIGHLAYQQYLDTAKRSLRLDSTIIGIERISFDVDQKGQITDFKIEQSLSPAHDAGIIQLITSGPSWRLLRGRKARALVSLRFP